MHAKKANEIACQNFDQSELKSLRGDKVSGWDTLRMKARAFKARFLGTHLTHGFRMLRHSVCTCKKEIIQVNSPISESLFDEQVLKREVDLMSELIRGFQK